MVCVVKIDEIMAKLNPTTRSRVQAANEIVIEKLPVPSISMNLGLKGGLGYGRQTLIWGNKSSGKSSFCLQAVAGAQREGKVCAWIDAEHSFDKVWAERLGVDTEQLIVSQVKTTEDMVSVCTELIAGGVDVLVVDSISALMSSVFFDKSNDLKELGDTKQIGADARDMANAVRMINYVNKNTAFIIISQIRMKISSWGASGQPTGGEAVKFFSSTSVKLTSSPREDVQLKGEVQIGDKIFVQPVGRPVNWQIEFNKLGPPAQTGEYNFYYDGEFIGIDSYGEIIDRALKFGVIKKSGTWYSKGLSQAQGKQKFADLLREDEQLYDIIVKELNEQI